MKKFYVFVFIVVFAVNSLGRDLKNQCESVSIPITVKLEIVEDNKVDEDIKIFDDKIVLKDKNLKVLAISKERVCKKNGVIKINNCNKKIVEMDVKI